MSVKRERGDVDIGSAWMKSVSKGMYRKKQMTYLCSCGSWTRDEGTRPCAPDWHANRATRGEVCGGFTRLTCLGCDVGGDG